MSTSNPQQLFAVVRMRSGVVKRHRMFLNNPIAKARYAARANSNPAVLSVGFELTAA